MRNFLVPHSTQTERVAGRPFFMVTASMSLDPGFGLALHAVNLDRFGWVWTWVNSPASDDIILTHVAAGSAATPSGGVLRGLVAET